MAEHKPKVTVFMPVYNGASYIGESIFSILNQTFTDFELLIINDGSTDDSVEIISSFKDKRIRLLHNEKNMGLVYTRNRGLDEAKGKYLALLDCDDIAEPERLLKQVEFLEAHTDFVMVGSWVRCIDETGNFTGIVFKDILKPEEIRATLLFYNAFAQSSLTIRREYLGEERYDKDFPLAEDYDLWVRLVENHKAWNYPEYLVRYRVHSTSTTNTLDNEKRMDTFAECIIKRQLLALGVALIDRDLIIHRKISHGMFDKTKEFVIEAETWLLKLYKANQKNGKYDDEFLRHCVFEQWTHVLNANTCQGLWTLKYYFDSPLSSLKRMGFKRKIKFFIKCLIKWSNGVGGSQC